MSWDVYLKDPVTYETIVFDTPHYMRGGTYQVGGANEAWLNITYNYSKHFKIIDKDRGIHKLQGLSGAESLPLLNKAISVLDDDADPDYWAPTEGNAKRALLQLKAMACMRPDGIWEVI
ncbi:MAG: hypothetical protein OEY10_00165 [Nitrosopumilus sp.]|nr:hypothetical protein [Nitrosopumilus sp.]